MGWLEKWNNPSSLASLNVSNIDIVHKLIMNQTHFRQGSRALRKETMNPALKSPWHGNYHPDDWQSSQQHKWPHLSNTATKPNICSWKKKTDGTFCCQVSDGVYVISTKLLLFTATKPTGMAMKTFWVGVTSWLKPPHSGPEWNQTAPKLFSY